MLELDRLHALARQIAAERATWERHVAHDPDERTFHLLHEDDEVSAGPATSTASATPVVRPR